MIFLHSLSLSLLFLSSIDTCYFQYILFASSSFPSFYIYFSQDKDRRVIPHLSIRLWGFPGGSVVKNLPAVQETQEMWVWSLGWEDSLEQGMATTPVFLTRNSIEEPGGLQPVEWQRVRHDWAAEHMFTVRLFTSLL